MTRERAVDVIRSLTDSVIGEFSTSKTAETEMLLECAQIIEALAPDLLDEHEREVLNQKKTNSDLST
jgi:hypothetical protein